MALLLLPLPWLLLLMLLLGSPTHLVAAQASCGLTLHEGVALGSDHFFEQDNSTVAHCCALCSKTPKCVSFVFSRKPAHGGAACFLMPNAQLGAKGKEFTSGCRGATCTAPPPPPPPPIKPAPKGAHNVLMLAVDDLRPTGAAFGEPEVLVPTLDKLASESVVFDNAWVQAATCGVSRASLLTGRRPDTTEVLNNGVCPFTVNPQHAEWVSLPQYFRLNGFTTAGLGKIWHPNVCEGALVGEQAASWSLPYYHAPCISLGSIYNGSCFEDYPFKLPGGGKKVVGAYANASATTDDDTPDGMIAKHAVKILTQLAGEREATGKPFFLAVGFHKPHLPHIAPKRYFDMYPIEKVSLPKHEAAPKGLPAVAWNDCGEFKSYPDNAEAARVSGFSQDHPFNATWTRSQRQAYFAAASFMDAQLAKVMGAMESLQLMDTTVIALWGDHGWHLGENNEWAKHTAFSYANHAPLLFRLPGQSGGAVVGGPQGHAEFVDIFPTLTELAGLEPPSLCATPAESAAAPLCTEGVSLASTVRDPTKPAKHAAFYQWPKGKAMGYSIATTVDGWSTRYTEWVLYDKVTHVGIWSNVSGVELYNKTADPQENVNLAGSPELADAKARLSAQLHAGWRAMLS